MDEVSVLCIVKIGADKEARKVENVAEEGEETGKGGDAFAALPRIEICIGATGIKDVPGKSGEFHGEDHLGARDLDGFIAVMIECAYDVTRCVCQCTMKWRTART